MAHCYQSGKEILPGDRINLGEMPGYVVFVLGCEDVPFHWIYLEGEGGPKIMLNVKGMGHVLEDDSEEDLTFVGRAQVTL